MEESAISTIRKYVDKRFPLPSMRLRGGGFDQLSYSRWAAEEIIDKLTAQMLVPPWVDFVADHKTPVELVQEFIDQMEYHAEQSMNIRNWFIFTTARNAAMGVLEEFL